MIGIVIGLVIYIKVMESGRLIFSMMVRLVVIIIWLGSGIKVINSFIVNVLVVEWWFKYYRFGLYSILLNMCSVFWCLIILWLGINCLMNFFGIWDYDFFVELLVFYFFFDYCVVCFLLVLDVELGLGLVMFYCYGFVWLLLSWLLIFWFCGCYINYCVIG